MSVSPLILAFLSTTAELNALSHAEFAAQQPFALTGTVTSVLYGNHFIVADATGRAHIRCKHATVPSRGDRVALSGLTEADVYRQEQSAATNVTVIGAGVPDEVVDATVREVAEGERDYANVRVSGIVVDAFRDDISPEWNYLIIGADGRDVYVTVPGEWPNFDRFTRARVSVVGTVVPNHCGVRRFIGPHIETSGADTVTVLTPSGTSDADAPPLEHVNHLRPNEVVRLGLRTMDGYVLSAWGGHSILLMTLDGEVHRVDLRTHVEPPVSGSFVRVCGLPETDLYRINMSKAGWRPADAPKDFPPWNQPEADALKWKTARRHQHFHGKTVTVTGQVLDEPDERSDWRAVIRCASERLAVDVSGAHEVADLLTAGTVVEVSGCGLLDTDNWHPGTPFPLLKQTVVVVRTPDDVRVISRPPWWTSGRLLAVIGALAGLLVAIFIWNRVLKRLVERRSRQLAREESARASAEFRTVERTRLAAEMHDSLSQSLTGISCQIDAMDIARTKRPERLEQHLQLARRMLDSSRNQLRNCLWDLRSNTLNERDIATAIRKTVQHLAGGARIDIDFPAPRTAFSDTVFHEILCIVRELVTNAARHGRAAHIRIAGRLDAGLLTLTVSDDGRGFDPVRRPGSAEGHFGLLGVMERLERLNGSMSIDSAPGRGAVFTLSFANAT